MKIIKIEKINKMNIIKIEKLYKIKNINLRENIYITFILLEIIRN